MKILRHLQHVIRFMMTPREQRGLVFYSEGRNYWPHLEGLLRQLLATSDTPICYFSSGADDPGLALEHPNLRCFETDQGRVRDWLFENLDADIVIMTMPDLHQFQLKRSRNPVHYVYVQHSLVSLHMIYRPGAFDHYDTIFCAGPHHVEEAKAMQAQGNLPSRNVVEHGYSRLDAILAAAATRPPREDSGNTIHVLIAPSWGPHCIVETIGERVVDDLLSAGFQVTLRPHPQTFYLAEEKIDAILGKHGDHPRFELEKNVDGQESLHRSDLMISDWSGAALEYAFGLEKPVLFIDVPRKVNNPSYEALGLEPIEASIRERLGRVLSQNDLGELASAVRALAADDHHIAGARSSSVFNVGGADAAGATAVIELLSEVREAH